MEKIDIYTDGSSKGNPGPGGFGAIIIKNNNQSQSASRETQVREIGGREEQTTNNRMEMQAAIESLKYLNNNLSVGSQVKLHTDSEYLLKGATIWIQGWVKNGWRTKNKKEVLNQDLWQLLLYEIEKVKEKGNLTWEKVLGHSGHKFNERCDRIATSFAEGEAVKLYEGYYERYKI